MHADTASSSSSSLPTGAPPLADIVSNGVLLPTMLFVNFGIFQYLVLLFRRRARREPFVLLLLVIAAVGSAVLMGFSVVSEPTRMELVRVSNFCLALVLLVQTAHLDAGVAAAKGGEGSLQIDSGRASRLAVRLAMVVADLLILYDAGTLAISLAHLVQPSVMPTEATAVVHEVAENLTLLFTFSLRFGLLTRRKGWRLLLRDDALEVSCHVALVAQEYPFLMLVADDATDTSGDARGFHGIPWLYIQSICLRATMLPCVWMTIGQHHYNILHSNESPTTERLSQLPDHTLHDLIQKATLVVASKSGGRSSVSVSRMASRGQSAVVLPVASIAEEHQNCERSGDRVEPTISAARDHNSLDADEVR